MTSDAKIGLLLGLIFIFITAFIINGLPNFRANNGTNELTSKLVNSEHNTPSIVTSARQLSRDINRVQRIEPRTEKNSLVDSQEIRFKAPLPESRLVVKDTVGPRAKVEPANSGYTEKKEKQKVEPTGPIRPRVYCVRQGDSLASIATKFYGPEEGNKRINVKRIFEANRGLLKSPDELYAGQKIIIPPLSSSPVGKNELAGFFESKLFEKVDSIGKRLLSAKASKERKVKEHVVQEGDSLWQIAAEELGDGRRYGEIVKLNSGILEDEDKLTVGMRLKLPAR